MEELLYDLLNTITPNHVYKQGSMTESYPDTFITYWVESTEDNTHYDNKTNSVNWLFNIIVYTNQPSELRTTADSVRTTLKENGFIPQGKGNDMPCDDPNFYGWLCNYYYIEKEM